MAVLPASHPLRRLFSGAAEQTFTAVLGIGDPPVIDYLAELLVRFIRADELHRLRGEGGRRLEEVAEMLLEAEGLPPGGRTRREFFRHIGDFTLFWTGVYPEALGRLRSKHTKDFFVDYCAQGKRSYYIASTFAEEPYEQEAPVLRRLSDNFEMFSYGLRHVRREWERRDPDDTVAALTRLIH